MECKSKLNPYTRKGEAELTVFEDHIKEKIARRTDSPVITKWTFSLLSTLAIKERQTEKFRDCEALKDYSFSARYWSKFMDRHGLNFPSRKSDQKNFSKAEIETFKADLNRKIMFYPSNQILNIDESFIIFFIIKRVAE